MRGFFPNGVTYTLCVITKEKNALFKRDKKTRLLIFRNVEMWTYSGGNSKRVEKLYLYLTRKARRREEQSCSRQEKLQRNEASDGRGFRP